MKKLLTPFSIIIIASLLISSCKKEKSTTPSNPTIPVVTTDTTVNVDLVLVAYNPGGVPPQTLDILTYWSGSPNNLQSMQGYQNISGVYWYNTSSAPTISSPCTTTSMSLVMKFSKTKVITIDIRLDTSVRNCQYDPITQTITNNAGTFQIDRTCKAGKWVILCSK